MDPTTVSLLMDGLRALLPEETSIAVSNRHTFIFYQPSKHIDLKIRPGDTVDENTITFNAIQQQKKVCGTKDSSLFGIPYYGTSIPLTKDGVTTGAITTVSPPERVQLTTSFLTAKTADCWLPIRFEDITYLEARNRKTYVHSAAENSTHRLNLSELASSLPKAIFVRCHRSYIVNLNHIKEIHPDSHSTFLLIMKDDAKIPVSQSFSSHFRKLMNF